MGEKEQENHRTAVTRVPLGAFVDAEQRRELGALAARQDRSVSSIVRRALTAELQREHAPESRD